MLQSNPQLSGPSSGMLAGQLPPSGPVAVSPGTVLIVDPDPSVRKMAVEFLRQHGFAVYEAESVRAARHRLVEISPDIVIFEVLTPGEDGLALARDLSGRSDLLLIILSSLVSEVDRIVGLEAGADDYLVKPMSMRELLARIRAVRRRLAKHTSEPAASSTMYSFAGWRLDVDRHVLHDPSGARVALSEGEFSLLRAFVERPRRVLSRDQLLEFARGAHCDAYDRAVDTQVSRLRRKLQRPSGDQLIRTVRSEGYLFTPEVLHPAR